MSPYALFIGFVLLVCGLGFLLALDESRRNRRFARELAEARRRAESRARIDEFSRETREAFLAQLRQKQAERQAASPIHDEIAAERLRAQLNDDEALRRWLA